jgi:hypothetical protein
VKIQPRRLGSNLTHINAGDFRVIPEILSAEWWKLGIRIGNAYRGCWVAGDYGILVDRVTDRASGSLLYPEDSLRRRLVVDWDHDREFILGI